MWIIDVILLELPKFLGGKNPTERVLHDKTLEPYFLSSSIPHDVILWG